ncbi:MAG TPA: hypothetical protein VLX58_14380 [Bryobacteraceae bacterium]|nr:hypothetical protein [Bryobacteraceae bacterium]
MHDYVYPSIFFSYFFFVVLGGGAVYFFIRSLRDGYWGPEGEDVKYRVLEDDQPE